MEFRKVESVSRSVSKIAGALLIALSLPACAISNGPKYLPEVEPAAQHEPVLRVGEISETLTGSWTQDPGIGTSAIRSPMIDALKESDVAARFSHSSSNLTLNIDLTTDHESDGPRLANLGGLSLLTLGILPLNYNSHWDVDCHVEVIGLDGAPLADYTFHERGSYEIWAMPLTMFTLLGAGIRGESDGQEVFKRVATNLARKIAVAMDDDHARFAARVGRSRPAATVPEVPVEKLRPLIP
jgi:hypothetical protein